MRQTIKEAYNIKYGYGDVVKSFDKLEDAVDFINTGMKNKDSEHFVLFRDNQEMIWLDHYRDRNFSDVGYTVSRHNDKSIEFDNAAKVLKVKEEEVQLEDNKAMRDIIVRELFKLKGYNAGQFVNKCRFVDSKKEPTKVDFENKIVYYDDYAERPDIAKDVLTQYKAKNESLAEDALEELFGFGKKKEKKNLYLMAMFRDSSNRIFTADLWDDLYWKVRKVDPNVERSNRNYFAAATLRQCEFVATEHEFDRLKSDIERLVKYLPSRYYVGVDTVNYSGEVNSDIKRSTSNLIKFVCLKKDIKESLDETTDYDFTRYKMYAEILIEREYGEDTYYSLVDNHKYYQEFEPEYILLYELADQGKYVIVITGDDTVEEFNTIEEARAYWDEFFSEPDDEESFVKDAADNWHTQEW